MFALVSEVMSEGSRRGHAPASMIESWSDVRGEGPTPDGYAESLRFSLCVENLYQRVQDAHAGRLPTLGSVPPSLKD